MPTPSEAYADLLHRSRELALLQSCRAVLDWDQQTYMPKGGAAIRGEQAALIAKLAHAMATDPIVGERLAVVEGTDVVAEADSIPAANVRELRHAYDRATKLPARLIEELALASTAAHEAWVHAKKNADFATFRPHLETILKLKREEATAVGIPKGGHVYDALLDEYEPGATAAELTVLFADLTAQLVPLVKAIGESSRKPDSTILHRDCPIDRQKWFAESAAAAIGFDFNGGRLDTAPHPFCTTFGPGDCRLTTRYNVKSFEGAFFGVLHEAGHGIYEQNLPAEHFGTPCGNYCSLGIHESQSRLWENLVGRGGPFWRHFFPRLKQAFPSTFDDVKPDAFLFAINEVRPSLIRTESDEATYNLHVAIRFELEKALLTGDLHVADLPAAWNEKYHHSLGVQPRNDAEGCLQDVHWSFGGFGYFPTYTLGNLYAAQLMDAAQKELSNELSSSFEAGDYSHLKNWLGVNIHCHGRRYRASELCRRATGTTLSSDCFLIHLREKFGPLYGVC